MNNQIIEEFAINLHRWFRFNQYKGIDPYQLDEKTFSSIKKFPILQKVRRYLKPFHGIIPKGIFNTFPHIYHPKAIALIISGNCHLYHINKDQELLSENNKLLPILKELRSPNNKYYGWGHPFEWGQNPRVPKDTPALGVICPVGQSLLDLYVINKDRSILKICDSIVDYLLLKKNQVKVSKTEIALLYAPQLHQLVYNVQFQAAAFLLRYNRISGMEKNHLLIDNILQFGIDNQQANGSWEYADRRRSRSISYIDNRHTGFILESLSIIYALTGDKKIFNALEKGKKYYLSNFIEDNIPKSTPEKTFPVDIHDVAQAIITLTQLDELQKAKDIILFAIDKVSDHNSQFYYKLFKDNNVNKTVFIRWGQAWMYKAITYYLDRIYQKK